MITITVTRKISGEQIYSGRKSWTGKDHQVDQLLFLVLDKARTHPTILSRIQDREDHNGESLVHLIHRAARGMRSTTRQG